MTGWSAWGTTHNHDKKQHAITKAQKSYVRKPKSMKPGTHSHTHLLTYGTKGMPPHTNE